MRLFPLFGGPEFGRREKHWSADWKAIVPGTPGDQIGNLRPRTAERAFEAAKPAYRSCVAHRTDRLCRTVPAQSMSECTAVRQT